LQGCPQSIRFISQALGCTFGLLNLVTRGVFIQAVRAGIFVQNAIREIAGPFAALRVGPLQSKHSDWGSRGPVM
jgi:hypothetical protein